MSSGIDALPYQHATGSAMPTSDGATPVAVPLRPLQHTPTSMNPRQLEKGHPRLAELMGRRPQQAIYRRFGYLNAQNLLYMQAELICLEERLKELQLQDSQTVRHNIDLDRLPEDSPIRRALDWEALSKQRHNGGQCEQWDLAMKIRKKLKSYNKALIQQIHLASAGEPDVFELEWIQRFVDTKAALKGKDRYVWGSKELPELQRAPDLVALRPPPKRDWFNSWIRDSFVKWYLNRRSFSSGLPKHRSLKEKTLVNWTLGTTSVVTSSLPILSIVVLHFTPGANARLALLAVFNFLAAFVLTVCTEAQPMQVFAASAAYSAVNIVFVGTNATATT